MDHYHCHTSYIPETRGTRTTDTTDFFPSTCNVPTISPTDAAIFAAQDLVQALENRLPSGPSTSLGDAQTIALRQLAHIFQTSFDPISSSMEKTAPPPRVDKPPPRVPTPPLRVMLPPRIPVPSVWTSPRHSTPPPHWYPTQATSAIANFLGTIASTDKAIWTPITMLKHKYKHEPVWLPHMANSVIDSKTGEELEYCQLIKKDEYRDI
jgi:hypothetical protein